MSLALLALLALLIIATAIVGGCGGLPPEPPYTMTVAARDAGSMSDTHASVRKAWLGEGR